MPYENTGTFFKSDPNLRKVFPEKPSFVCKCPTYLKDCLVKTEMCPQRTLTFPVRWHLQVWQLRPMCLDAHM